MKMFQSLIGILQTEKSCFSTFWNILFQSLIGILQTKKKNPKLSKMKDVSIPHRYSTNQNNNTLKLGGESSFNPS